MDLDSELKRYKNPFKYLNPSINNIFNWTYIYSEDYFILKDKNTDKTNLFVYYQDCHDEWYSFPKNINIITALYIPEDFLPFYIRLDSSIGGFYQKWHYVTNPINNYKLYGEDMDLSEYKIDLSEILSLCKNPYIFNRHIYGQPEIICNSKKFIRFEPFSPYLPYGLVNFELFLIFTKRFNFYVECIGFSNKNIGIYRKNIYPKKISEYYDIPPYNINPCVKPCESPSYDDFINIKDINGNVEISYIVHKYNEITDDIRINQRIKNMGVKKILDFIKIDVSPTEWGID